MSDSQDPQKENPQDPQVQEPNVQGPNVQEPNVQEDEQSQFATRAAQYVIHRFPDAVPVQRADVFDAFIAGAEFGYERLGDNFSFVLSNGQHVGRRIRFARIYRRMSLADVAEACGVTRQAVSLWEGGRLFTSEDTLSMLSEVFQIPLSFLKGNRIRIIIEKHKPPNI
jgi:DNA-binding XRE family transcriptional regulator